VGAGGASPTSDILGDGAILVSNIGLSETRPHWTAENGHYSPSVEPSAGTFIRPRYESPSRL